MDEMRLTLTVAPTEEPVSIARANLHLRLEGDEATADQPLVEDLIEAATLAAENFTKRQFVTATYDIRFDSFPWEIRLPRPPLQSVVSIKYIDTDEVEQTVPTADYQVDIHSTVGRILPIKDKSWPDTNEQLNAVVVKFIAGYGAAADVPEQIRTAIRLTLGHLYEHRETVLVGVTASELPQGADALLWPYRIINQ